MVRLTEGNRISFRLFGSIKPSASVRPSLFCSVSCSLFGSVSSNERKGKSGHEISLRNRLIRCNLANWTEGGKKERTGRRRSVGRSVGFGFESFNEITCDDRDLNWTFSSFDLAVTENETEDQAEGHPLIHVDREFLPPFHSVSSSFSFPFPPQQLFIHFLSSGL